MPPVRHNPSQRVHDRVIHTGGSLQPTAESSSPSGGALRNTSQKQHFSPVWYDHQFTPAAQFLLINGVDSPVLHNFSPVLVHDSSRIFDPASNLPLPPKPNASYTQDIGLAQPIHRAASVPSDPFLLASPSSSTTLLGPPISKPHTYPSPSLPSTADASSTACTYQPSAQPARPPNNFVLFRADYFARVKSLHISPHHYASLPKDNDQWNQAPESVKSYYRELARLTKEVHGRLHPGYKYKPRKKDEMQRQKDEKARFKRETMAKAKASRTDKAQVKSSRTPAAKTTPPSAPTTSVDIRMYDPARGTYYRPHPSEARSMYLPSPLQAPPDSPSPGSTPSARSGVRNAARFQDADPVSSSSSPQVTSPACTLFQAEESESPRLEHSCCNTYGDANNKFDAAVTLWPTIEGDVDWYQVAPPHWCEPNNYIPFCDDENACDDLLSVPWSDDLNIDIPTAPVIPTKHDFAGPSYSFILDPALRMHSLPTLSPESSSFLNNPFEGLLASAMEATSD